MCIDRGVYLLKSVSIYSFIHALVDLSCVFSLNHIVSILGYNNSELILLVAVLYNFLAFALQLPIGFLADKLNKNRYISILGCFLVSLGMLCAFLVDGYFLFLPVLLVGLGNAFFHIGGGIDILNISNGKASLPGIYVSTGALGLFFGNYVGFNLSSFICLFSLLMLSIILLFYLDVFEKLPDNMPFKIDKPTVNQNFVLLFLFSAVCLRSFTGFAVSFDWKNSFFVGLLSTLCVVLGKLLGGLIGDKYGWSKVSNLSLYLASFLFIFAPSNMLSGLFGLFLFNMTMPLTLTALSNTFPNSKGMAFGLTTVALFLGYILEILLSPYIDNLSGSLVLLVCGLLSLLVMHLGLKYYKKG